MAAEKRPYDADHAIYRSSCGGQIITVYWTADLAIAAKLADPDVTEDEVNRLVLPFDSGVEIAAVATRHYKYEGADFSGWVVETKGYPTDPIPNKRQALVSLRAAVADYFPAGRQS